LRQYVAELIGTFFLVLTVGFAVVSGNPLAPVAIGVVLAVMVYAGGHLSGGHFNPAVSLAAWIRGRLDLRDLPPYWAAQLAGAVLAAGVVRLVVTRAPAPMPAFTGRHLMAALVVELLFTFALAYTVLNVATSRSHPQNGFYGAAIGGVVLAAAVAVGGVSGGMFNPAVALGASLMALSSWGNLWVFVVANLAGGAAAAYVFRALNPADA
jgi:aquaporin Z